MESIRDFRIGELLYERKSGDNLKFRWQLTERPEDGFAQAMSHRRGSCDLVLDCHPAGPRAHFPEMVERNICRYPSHPCTKAPGGVKLGAPAVDPPECIDKDLFGDAHVSDNPDCPLINFGVVLPVQRFEGVHVALHEPRKKLATWFVPHRPLPCLTRPVVRRFRTQGSVFGNKRLPTRAEEGGITEPQTSRESGHRRFRACPFVLCPPWGSC